MKDFIARTRKFLIAVPGVAAALVTAGILPDSIAATISSIIGALTALLVYVVPNAPSPAAVDAAVEAKLNAAPGIDS